MKKAIIFYIFLFPACLPLCRAQLTVGGSGLFIKSGTDVFIDSLTLQPSADLTINDNALEVGYVPIPGSPTGSIGRVYYWDAPVTFSGTAEKYETHHALLQWITAEEENADQFEIEHSADGYLFAKIGTVPARNRSDEQQYRFIDQAKRTGIHYYRLASRDLDGSVSLTNIRAVVFDQDAAFKVFPNPTTQLVTVSGVAEGATLRIVSMTGKTVFSGRAADANGMTVGVGNLAAGERGRGGGW